MRWSKFFIIIQAVLVLVIGITLVSRVLYIELNQTNQNQTRLEQEIEAIDLLQEKFKLISYILTIIGSIELILISRLIKN